MTNIRNSIWLFWKIVDRSSGRLPAKNKLELKFIRRSQRDKVTSIASATDHLDLVTAPPGGGIARYVKSAVQTHSSRRESGVKNSDVSGKRQSGTRADGFSRRKRASTEETSVRASSPERATRRANNLSPAATAAATAAKTLERERERDREKGSRQGTWRRRRRRRR